MTSISVGSDVQGLVQRLRPLFGERLLLPADPVFESARQVWNAAVTHRPAAIARCVDVADVQAGVRAAREFGLPLSVRSGGHDWAGRALCADGLVLDVTPLRQVTVDRRAGTVTAGGGATVGRVLAAAAEHGLATPTGVVRAVGFAGLTMAGGYGPINGRYGLAVDNLVGADLVGADGGLLRAAPDIDPDLYWAVRGGGGNFGVATSLTYRVHELPTVLAGMIMFPLAQARSVLTGYREVVATAPDALTVMSGFLPGPEGPVVFLCPFWCGTDLAQGERLINGLHRFGEPVLSRIAPMPYVDALGMFDGSMADGNHYLLRTRWLPADLPDDVMDALIGAAEQISSPFSAIALHHFHGAAGRVAPDATAFGLRADHLLLEVIAVWPPTDDAVPHRTWADRLSAAVAPLALPGGYPNLLAPEDVERVRLSYGANLTRLMAAKDRYDPDNVFASAVPTLIPRDRG